MEHLHCHNEKSDLVGFITTHRYINLRHQLTLKQKTQTFIIN